MKNNSIDVTGGFLVVNPISAVRETFIAGMDISVSLEARLKYMQLFYAGIGITYYKGRDYFKNKLNINKKSNKVKILFDGAYTSTFNLICGTSIYLSNGSSTKETLTGTLTNVVTGLFMGPLIGYSADVFRDLVGTKTFDKLPTCLNTKNKNLKKLYAAGLVGSSVLATSGVYTLKHYMNS